MNKKTEFLENLCVVDIETNNLDFREAEVVEFGLSLYDEGKWGQFSHLFSTHVPIPPEVSAVTHITNDMMSGKDNFDSFAPTVKSIFDDKECLVAHNVFYENKVLSKYLDIDTPWVCTMRLAKLLYSDDDTVKQYSLSYLRYRFNLSVKCDSDPHRADFDAHVCSKLLDFLLAQAESKGVIDSEKDYLPQLVEVLEKPIIYSHMPFGKYAGEKMEEIPLDYWKWAIDNMWQINKENEEYDADLEASVVHAVNMILDED